MSIVSLFQNIIIFPLLFLINFNQDGECVCITNDAEIDERISFINNNNSDGDFLLIKMRTIDRKIWHSQPPQNSYLFKIDSTQNILSQKHPRNCIPIDSIYDRKETLTGSNVVLRVKKSNYWVIYYGTKTKSIIHK